MKISASWEGELPLGCSTSGDELWGCGHLGALGEWSCAGANPKVAEGDGVNPSILLKSFWVMKPAAGARGLLLKEKGDSRHVFPKGLFFVTSSPWC